MSRFATASQLDKRDELRALRRQFEIPQIDGAPAIYLCGHSLGLMPRRARALVDRELNRWADQGVDAHFGEGAWFDYHRRLSAPLAKLLGAQLREVVAMNSLTVNLHLLMTSFYRPQGRRRRIVIEAGAFPSDRYAVAAQIALHGGDPQRDLIELTPADPDSGLQPSDLHSAFAGNAERIALVLLPGVQYLTGQVLDIKALTRVAHDHDCPIGFDLAHAVGNVALRLHDAGPDFAVWCSYKYLNGGPGAIGGAFVHARHAQSHDLPRLAGWWGHDEQRRFAMEHDFVPMPGAEGWQLSNPSIFSIVPLQASLELFSRAGRRALQKKSQALSRFMTQRASELLDGVADICAPQAVRGSQISLQLRDADAQHCATLLRKRRIVVDTRRPNILRLAATPLYNRFMDIERALQALAQALR